MLFKPIPRIDNSSAPKNALKKFSTSNPGAINPANINSKAFITKVKSPNVRIFIGRVIKISIGLMNTLIKAITTDTIKAFQNPSTEIPGIIQDINIIIKAKPIQRKNKYITKSPLIMYLL